MRNDYDYLDEDDNPIGHWEPITCEERNVLLAEPAEAQPGQIRYRAGLTVFSSYTNMNRNCYTEWGEKGSGVPLVYDYLHSGNLCDHARFVKGPRP